MKLIVLFFILSITTSWQQDSAETLNETLDRLIKQTNTAEHSTNVMTIPNSKNSSRIIIINSPEEKKETEIKTQSEESSIKTGDNNLSILDILHALGLRESKSEDDDKHNTKTTIEEIKNTEDTESKITDTTNDLPEVLKQLISKTTRFDKSGDDSEDVSWSYVAGDDLLHKYPEIIIDRVTYQDQNNKAEEGSKSESVTEKQEVNKNNEPAEKNNQEALLSAQELKALLDELHKMKVNKPETDSEISLQKSDHNHNHKVLAEGPQNDMQQPCNSVNMLPYSPPCKSVLLNKLLEYQNLLNRDPGLDTNLQLNIWGARSARQYELMRISRAQKLKRIHFITQLINKIMSSFVYRPLYGYF